MDLHVFRHSLGQNFTFVEPIPLAGLLLQLKGLLKGLERGEAKQIVLRNFAPQVLFCHLGVGLD